MGRVTLIGTHLEVGRRGAPLLLLLLNILISNVKLLPKPVILKVSYKGLSSERRL